MALIALLQMDFLFVSLSFDLEEAKRGFRKGASDRFSHGFGKRDMEEVLPKK